MALTTVTYFSAAPVHTLLFAHIAGNYFRFSSSSSKYHLNSQHARAAASTSGQMATLCRTFLNMCSGLVTIKPHSPHVLFKTVDCCRLVMINCVRD